MLHEEYKGYQIEVWNDDFAENPRDWGNLGTIYADSRRITADGYSLDDMDEAFKEDGDFKKSFLRDNIVLPIYFYDHSAFNIFTDIQLSNLCPHFRWDGGLLGYIVVSRERARRELQVKKLAAKDVDKVKAILAGEIETFNRYLNGAIFGYTIIDEDGNDVDSCGGYFDTPEELIDMAKELIDDYDNPSVAA